MLSLRVRAFVLTIGCCGIAALGHVNAQVSSAEQAAYMAGLRVDRSMLAGPLAPSPRSAMRLGGTSEYTGRETREVNLIGNGVVLEMPRVNPDGSYERPRILIGRQSPELAAWMKELGLPPERCMLPMFRGRLSREPETGRIGMALLMTGRCTFY